MNYSRTIQKKQKLGRSVDTQGKTILKNFKPYAKTTSGNSLYNDYNYLVTTAQNSVTLEFVFGRAEDYWQFVDEGVRGADPGKHKGRPRAVKSPFKYSNKMPPRSAIDRWIVRKPLKAARDNGKFIPRKSLAFAIQKSIFEKGLYRTQFFSRPFNLGIKKQEDSILKAFADDLDAELDKLYKN